MAANNYFTVVNFSGKALNVTVDGQQISVPQNGDPSAIHKFSQSGDQITVDISGNSVDMPLSGGDNSWTTLVYTTVGKVNVFNGSPALAALNY
ncbi:MAG: hypothetical protein R8G66_33040 [Cytophagales bacterium]|nr:hypothetical protein [Cytophagales bacterium]